MRAEAHDDWLGRGGNPRRSDLTWRRSPLPRGHEPSLTAGVIVLFPGPLTQVRQRRRVRRANRNRVWLAFTHTTANHLLSFIIGHYFCTSIVYYSHEALWSIFRRACVCVCVCVGLVLCHHMLCVYILCYLPRALFSCSRRCEFQVFVWWYDYIFTALYTFMLFDFFLFFFCVSASSLSAYACHNPSLYAVLFKLQLPIVLRLNRSVVTAEKPDTLRLDVCIMFICAVVVYPSFHLSTSFRLLLPVT